MRIVLAGALGEVGSALSRALIETGHHVVPVSARAPIPRRPDVLPVAGLGLTDIDLLVNASGPGDRRTGGRSGRSTAAALAQACRDAGVPGVLISTTRVLEGAQVPACGDDPSAPTTAYGRANAALEEQWLADGGGRVLRLANFLCRPMSMESPQAGLLPWSLVGEALQTGAISVRSAPSVSREFVDAYDVVRALAVVSEPDAPRITAMVPGSRMTMMDLADAVARAFDAVGRPPPMAQFGSQSAQPPSLQPGWLSQRGWQPEVTSARLAVEIAEWIVDAAYTSTPGAGVHADTGRGEP